MSSRPDISRSAFARPFRRRYDLHPPGLIYLVTTLFLAIGAFNSQNNLLFWAFGVGVAGLMVSGIVSGAPLMRLELARDPTPPAHVGKRLILRYRVRNRGRLWPACALRLDEFSASRPLDWMEPRFAAVAHVGPKEVVAADMRVNVTRRGLHELNIVRVSSTFPLGLIRKSLYFELPQRVLVRPAVAPLQESLRRRLSTDPHSMSEARNRPGRSGDFFALQEYLPGDPPRMIAWRASARRDTLVVRRHAMPAPPKIRIELARPSAGVSDAAFESSIALLASLLTAAARERLAPGLSVPWAGIAMAPMSSPGGIDRMLDVLARIDRHQSPSSEPPALKPDLVITAEGPDTEQSINGSDPATWAAAAITPYVPPTARRHRMIPLRKKGRR